MKASINAAGLLVIETETALESYALNQWTRQNFDPSTPGYSGKVLFICAAGTEPERQNEKSL